MRSNEQIRKMFLRNQLEEPVCLGEAAAFATDTTFPGFEDPRSSAAELFGHATYAKCGRRACTAILRIDKIEDTYEIEGTCLDKPVCAIEIRNETYSHARAKREERLIRRTSEEQLAFICPHVQCEFNYGYSIDGHAGTAGACMRGIEVNPDTTN